MQTLKFHTCYKTGKSLCPIRQTCSDKEELGAGEKAGRCEKQVFGSVNMCNQVIWPARENKHNLINTNTSNTHKGTYAELIFEGEIKAIFVCVPSCLKHSELRLWDADCALQKMSIPSRWRISYSVMRGWNYWTNNQLFFLRLSTQSIFIHVYFKIRDIVPQKTSVLK